MYLGSGTAVGKIISPPGLYRIILTLYSKSLVTWITWTVNRADIGTGDTYWLGFDRCNGERRNE